MDDRATSSLRVRALTAHDRLPVFELLQMLDDWDSAEITRTMAHLDRVLFEPAGERHGVLVVEGGDGDIPALLGWTADPDTVWITELAAAPRPGQSGLVGALLARLDVLAGGPTPRRVVVDLAVAGRLGGLERCLATCGYHSESLSPPGRGRRWIKHLPTA